MSISKRCAQEPNSTIRRSNQNGLNAKTASYPNLRPLNKDTVSFGSAGFRIADQLEAQFAAQTPRLRRIATNYLDTLEAISLRLKERGFSFDRDYCELNPVKSPASYISKIGRSGSLNVPDTIRATMYCNDAYDLENLVQLITEMNKRGYVVAETKSSVKDLIKRGYIPTSAEAKNPENFSKSVPDIDIRLDDSTLEIEKLPVEFRYAIGKPQKSGYEDIQIRFVRDYEKGSKPVPHELIILFGPNYSHAKHIESDKIYSHLRKFDELSMKFEDKAIGSNQHKANRYIDLIKEMFRGKVSQKLFLNAKNKDLYDMSDEAAITFSKEDKDVLLNYFIGLKNRLNKCYKEAQENMTQSEMVSKQLVSDRRHDTNIINKIKDGLLETIEHFNYQNDLKKS